MSNANLAQSKRIHELDPELFSDSDSEMAYFERKMKTSRDASSICKGRLSWRRGT